MANPNMAADGHFDISAIVCTYNRCGLLHESLSRITSQQSDGLRYEVIVVDNNSTDDTRQVIEAFAGSPNCVLRYVYEPQQGVSYARNAGIATARAPLLAFFDDDVLVSSDWLTKIKQTLDLHCD